MSDILYIYLCLDFKRSPKGYLFKLINQPEIFAVCHTQNKKVKQELSSALCAHGADDRECLARAGELLMDL